MTLITFPPELAITSDAPRVSVVVPTFNRAALLKETVDSILAQTFTNFELIIVDNMSEDGTHAYIAGLQDSRVRYFRNPNHGVIAVNRNHGIRQARASYIALCDDDDLWQPSKLEKQVEVLDHRPEVGLCYTNATTFNRDGIIDTWMMKKKVFYAHYRNLLIGNFIPNSTVLVRRRIVEEFGYLDVSPNFIAIEDYVMWLKVARNFSLAYLDEPLINYRVHSAANSSNVGVMAEKTFRVGLAEFRKNKISTFGVYALWRAYVRLMLRKIVS